MNFIKDAIIQPGTKVLVRGDLDVPLEKGEILETYRLQALLPTLEFLKSKEAQITVCGHIGKPKGKKVPELSTKPLEKFFEEKLNYRVKVLENLRFDPGEEANDPKFAAKLAENQELYVNDSFATCHREHASIVGIPKLLPSCPGLRMEQEIATLSNVMLEPRRPFTAIVGGAKIESKLPIINKFLGTADVVLVGGRIGQQWHDKVPEKLKLPVDYSGEGNDIGQATIDAFSQRIIISKTIIWAGPMGQYEVEAYIQGTKKIAEAVEKAGAFSILGGGDSIAAVNKLGMLEVFDFVSTGGGAMLEFLVKGSLPGIEALERNV